MTNLYRSKGKEWGHPEENLKVASHSWGFIADSYEKAVEDYFIPTKTMVDSIAKDRPHWRPLTKEQYLNSIGENGSMFVGDSKSVANKIIHFMENLEVDRFMLHLPIGSVLHEDVLNAIRLYGEEVAPAVRKYFEEK